MKQSKSYLDSNEKGRQTWQTFSGLGLIEVVHGRH